MTTELTLLALSSADDRSAFFEDFAAFPTAVRPEAYRVGLQAPSSTKWLLNLTLTAAREAWLAGGDASPLLKVLSAGVALIFPDLQLFNVIDEIAVGTILPAVLFWQVAGFGALYTLVYFLLAQVAFATREL